MNKYAFILLILLAACGRDRISVTKIKGPAARKTYFGLSDREYDSVQMQNPAMKDGSLEKAGLIKDGRLAVEKFNHGNADFELRYRNELIKGECGSRNDTLMIVLRRNKRSTEIVMDSPFTDFCIADVIPGGYHEIVALNKYYIVNGDNFDVTIYELK